LAEQHLDLPQLGHDLLGRKRLFRHFPVPFCLPVSLIDWYRNPRSGQEALINLNSFNIWHRRFITAGSSSRMRIVFIVATPLNQAASPPDCFPFTCRTAAKSTTFRSASDTTPFRQKGTAAPPRFGAHEIKTTLQSLRLCSVIFGTIGKGKSEVPLAKIGAPGIPVLNPMRTGTSRKSFGSTPMARWRFCQPATSAGNVTQPSSAPKANQRVRSFVLR